MDSHIQMPHFMLRRFENKNKQLFYYDIQGKYIGNKGYAKSINTKEDYYSDKVEDVLNNTIEQPFSKIVQYIDQIDFDSRKFSLTSDFVDITRAFLNALIARSPNTYDRLLKTSVFLQLYHQQSQHDVTVLTSINEAQKLGLFDEYYPTFTVNKTNIPFVLPVCGFYFFNRNKNLNLPISPQVAITMVNKEILARLDLDNTIRMYLVTKESEINRLNYFAFQEQKNQGYGRIVSPTRDALEKMQSLKPI